MSTCATVNRADKVTSVEERGVDFETMLRGLKCQDWPVVACAFDCDWNWAVHRGFSHSNELAPVLRLIRQYCRESKSGLLGLKSLYAQKKNTIGYTNKHG
jgi:hypothetical protein